MMFVNGHHDCSQNNLLTIITMCVLWPGATQYLIKIKTNADECHLNRKVMPLHLNYTTWTL